MTSSVTAIVHPQPLRSPEPTTVPTDAHSIQGALSGNIERLEEHAERMSESGSDLGEEIRKLQLEQKLEESRHSSFRSTPPADEPTRYLGTTSRNVSMSSHANSVVDVNAAARWGGYSPGGFVTSPVGSLRSGSFSQHPANLQRQRSGSKASRLGQITQAQEMAQLPAKPYEQPRSPQSPRSILKQSRRNSSPLSGLPAVSSSAVSYDQTTQQGNSHLDSPIALESAGPASTATDRPATAGSTDTTHKLRTLWQDFDGVHCPDTVLEEEQSVFQESIDRNSVLLRYPPVMPPAGAPPPDEDMVFYPAPVPRMLNLPKRLSKMPAASVQARRRTQLLDDMQHHNRSSGHLPTASGDLHSAPDRKSRQSLANLPPQLRASAYFDQPAPAQEFEVKGESARDTLDNILEASAHAPVSAFVDHPISGQVGTEVYGKEHKQKRMSRANDLGTGDNRKSRSSIMLSGSIDDEDRSENHKSRSSLNLLDTRRNSNGVLLNKLKKRNSSADLTALTEQTAATRPSLEDDLNISADQAEQNGIDSMSAVHARQSDGADEDNLAEPEHEQDAQFEEEADEEEEQYFGAPTTLLAELQLRKLQQKSRNLTAATAFPRGMHATLLELDAVAEVEKQKRIKSKINLAWEAQPQLEEDGDLDDDVPLGILYPERDGLVNKRGTRNTQFLSDGNRHGGMMQQRQLEDNEPLSKRRTRIAGTQPKRFTQLTGAQSQQHLMVPGSSSPQPESDEDESETLAQRMRRMKNQQALDDAIGNDIRKSTVSGDFAAEMLSQFGSKDQAIDTAKPSAAVKADDEEEETLGQRRARLQTEALSQGSAQPRADRPALRSSMSLADVLGAHPIDASHHKARKVTDEALIASLPQGSLLRANAEQEEQRRKSRLEMNSRASSYGSFAGNAFGANAGNAAAVAHMSSYGNMLTGNPNMMGAPMSLPNMMFAGQPMRNMSPMMNYAGQQRNSYFPQANVMGGQPGALGGMNTMNPQMMQMGMMGMQGLPVGNGTGMRHSSMMGMPGMMQMGGMPMGMGMGMPGQAMMVDPPMDPRHRQAIDRWREGVMH